MEKSKITQAANEIIIGELADKELFIVDVEIDHGNVITVTLDSDFGVNISDCIAISHYIEEKFGKG